LATSWVYLTLGVIVALIALGAVAIDTAIKQDMASESRITVLTDEERVIIRAAVSAAKLHPEVNKIIDRVPAHEIKYQKINDNTGRVIVVAPDLWIVEALDGNFTNGYNQTLKEKSITVDVDRMNNDILSVKTESRITDVVTIKFSENQKRAIAISLDDSRVQELLAGKDYYIVQVRERGVGIDGHCPEMECALVGFDLVSKPRGVLMATILNPNTGEVLDVKAGKGWE